MYLLPGGNISRLSPGRYPWRVVLTGLEVFACVKVSQRTKPNSVRVLEYVLRTEVFRVGLKNDPHQFWNLALLNKASHTQEAKRPK